MWGCFRTGPNATEFDFALLDDSLEVRDSACMPLSGNLLFIYWIQIKIIIYSTEDFLMNK